MKENFNLKLLQSDNIVGYGWAWIIILIYTYKDTIITERHILFKTIHENNMHENYKYTSRSQDEAEMIDSFINTDENLKSAIFHHFILPVSHMKKESYATKNQSSINLTKIGRDKLLQLKQFFQFEIGYIEKTTLCNEFSELLKENSKFKLT